MKRKTSRHQGKYQWKHLHHAERPIRWLPVDSRFFTPVLRFGSVKGIERVFLELEISLALLIVVGTFFVAAMRIVTMILK